MLEAVWAVPGVLAADLWASLPAVCGLAVFGTVLGVLPGAAGGRGAGGKTGWWRKPDLLTDVGYIVWLPAVMHYMRILLLVGGSAVLGVGGPGEGPLAGLGFWPQLTVYLGVSEVLLYGTHRLLHGRRLWRVHAVHHSSEHLEWISTHRVHPLDVLLHGAAGDCLLLLLGTDPAVLVAWVPVSAGMGALVHASLDWDYGWLRWVVVSPAMHRWHHTGVDRGGASNFASNLALLDVVFGTFYVPRGERPSGFGVTERDVPAGFAGQLLHPFRRGRRGEGLVDRPG